MAQIAFHLRYCPSRVVECLGVAAGPWQLAGSCPTLRTSLQPLLQPHEQPASTSGPDEWNAWFVLQRALLVELYFNLQLKALHGEWVDFLGRLFRLQEALLRLVFELETRHSTEKQPSNSYADFTRAIAENPDLAQFLAAAACFQDTPNTRTLQTSVRYWVKHGKGREYGPLLAGLELLGGQALGELRNKSILAHGYRGVSVEDVTNATGPAVDVVLGRIRAALRAVGANPDESCDPYEAVDVMLRAAWNSVSAPESRPTRAS